MLSNIKLNLKESIVNPLKLHYMQNSNSNNKTKFNMRATSKRTIANDLNKHLKGIFCKSNVSNVGYTCKF